MDRTVVEIRSSEELHHEDCHSRYSHNEKKGRYNDRGMISNEEEH